MNGLDKLNAMPTSKKDAITKAFGSINKLYSELFLLLREEFLLETKRIINQQSKLDAVKNKIYAIEDKIDALDMDGRDITILISADLSEIIASREVKKLNKYLEKFGTTFEEMREKLKSIIE